MDFGSEAGAGTFVRKSFDIVVHGRFHGFALARALIAMGHDVMVHTNYPAFVVERFGVPRSCVKTFVSHGLVSRALNTMQRWVGKNILDAQLHRSFGRWAARSVRRDSDVVYGFSGVMEEFLRIPTDGRQLRTLVRGSAHIEEQARILTEEARRVGVALDRPSQWKIDRERREYALADHVFVLSEFARTTFIDRGFDPSRVTINALGVDVRHFRSTEITLAARRARILSNAPLRVLNVGTFSFRKGIHDFLEITAELSNIMEFRFVGDTPPESAHLLERASKTLEMIDRVAEGSLAEHYAWADIFVFPTLEDGFAAVLLQAAAAGLPIISTGNSSAPDFLEEGHTGWVVPIRNAPAFIARLRWCHNNRQELAVIAMEASQRTQARDWSTMASEFSDTTQKISVARSAELA